MMKQQFTIGEIAKLHNIPESTLRYYDKKGIFKPKIVDENTQYRYYTIEQFSMLEIIKFLRHLDISLNEVKQFVEHRSPKLALQLFEKQTELLLERQKELEYMTLMIKKQITTIEEGLNQDSVTIIYKTFPKRPIYSMPVESDITDEEFIYHLNELQKKMHEASEALVSGRIGTFISKEGILRGRYTDYNGLFISIDDNTNLPEECSYIVGGDFACIYHKGSYDDNKKAIDLLLADIKRKKYKIIGDVIEIGIIDYSVTAEESEFVTEYQIPVERIE